MTAQAAAMTSAQSSSAPSHKDMANAIRALAMDAVEKAQSGHPGMPMGMADVATVLFSKFLKFDAANPTWADRDRFILSAGHGSMLQYALLYLTGYEKMTLDQIKNFRQRGSLTAGHPEVDPSCGIEMTTGPLGQGIATSTGFALAERILNARYSDDLVNHYTYVIASDGDLMEGISHESCALAGHLKLEKLIVLYDDNGITIDGSTALSYSEDVTKRFESYGWDVQSIDGHDPAQIERALSAAQKTKTPSLIRCKTHIGFGAPTKQDSASSHGSPLGEEEIKGARANLGWAHEPFVIPSDILNVWRSMGTRSQNERTAWQKRLDASPKKKEFLAALEGDVSKQAAPLFAALKKKFAEEKPKLATRQTSGLVLDQLAPALPTLIGGSADLTGSVNTKVKNLGVISKDHYDGQYIHYGVREHGMAALMNGLALHGGFIPYSGTFLSFADYCRPAIRLSALMKQRVVYVMTHDSIGLGEDGPTHQPVEHLASLRVIPNLLTMRPCDGVETAECWEIALSKRETPTVLALTRQALPTLCPDRVENMVAKGAYILKENSKEPEVTFLASGSEVEIALQAYEQLSGEGLKLRLISVPCMELLWQQDENYIKGLVCNDSIKIVVEAGVQQGWDLLTGGHGAFVGMTGFGESAPAKDLYEHFGITVGAIVKKVKDALKKS